MISIIYKWGFFCLQYYVQFLLIKKGGIYILKDLIRDAQNNNKAAMLELINKFFPLLKKYANKLNYEDAYADMLLFYIELIMNLDLNKLTNKSEGAIVTYISISVKNYHSKKVSKLVEAKKEINFCRLDDKQRYYVETKLATQDDDNIFKELGMINLLSENECQIIYLIYFAGFTVAEIAQKTKKSRQAVNQLKMRALRKLRDSLL